MHTGGDRISRAFFAAVDTYLIDEATRATRYMRDVQKVVDIPIFGPREPMTPVSTVTVTPEAYVPVGKEWLKISFNGVPVRLRKGVDRTVPATQLEIARPAVDRIGHIRVEGALEFNYPLILPPVTVEPYMVTCRNATASPLMVSSDGGRTVKLPPETTWFLLVDVDGVKRVE